MTSQRTEEEMPQGSGKTEIPQGDDTQKNTETKDDIQSKTKDDSSAQDGNKGENKERNEKSEKEGSEKQSGENESGERKHGTEKAKVSKEALEGPQGEPLQTFKTEAAPGEEPKGGSRKGKTGDSKPKDDSGKDKAGDSKPKDDSGKDKVDDSKKDSDKKHEGHFTHIKDKMHLKGHGQ